MCGVIVADKQPRWWTPIALTGAISVAAGGGGSYVAMREMVAAQSAETRARLDAHEQRLNELRERDKVDLAPYARREELDRAIGAVNHRISQMESQLSQRLDRILELLLR